jgi:uncharacterized protein involved in propanediol utilization
MPGHPARGKPRRSDAHPRTGGPNAERLMTVLDPVRLSSEIGHGSAIGHVGEIFQGLTRTETGLIVRALVSLPDPTTRSYATFRPTHGPVVRVVPAWRKKACSAAQYVLNHYGYPPGGVLWVKGNAQPGAGCGSSTSDVVAAVLAVANAYGIVITPERIAYIAVAVETASDSTMWGVQALLFAQRKGIPVEFFADSFPPLWVLWTVTGGPVDTEAFLPAPYDEVDLEIFAVLRKRLRVAFESGAAAELGAVATESAWINQRHLEKRELGLFTRIAEESGAVGVNVSHSGSGIGLLFDARDADVASRIEQARARLQGRKLRCFRIGPGLDR